jgi:diguanylate cyclase (GGDEF)-like protein/PAS domain S-box-containing protein
MMVKPEWTRDARAAPDPDWLLACDQISRPAMALDASLRVLHANKPALALLGVDFVSLDGAAIPAPVARVLEEARAANSEYCDVVWPASGSEVRLRLTVHRKAGDTGVLVVAFDADRGRDRVVVAGPSPAPDTLAHMKQELHALIDSIPGPSMLVDRDLRFRWVNQRYEQWIGRPSADLVGRRLDEFFDESQARERWPYWVCALSGVPATGERTVMLPNGARRALRVHYVPVHDGLGHAVGFYTVGSDIQDLRESEQRTSYLSNHDTLTGLPNRVLFRQMLSQAVAHGRRSRSMLALLLVDLDHFKDINETLGHGVGDELIRLVPLRMLEALRATDYLARISGDEFMVILEGIADAGSAEIAARKLLEAMERPFDVSGHRIYVTASVGICLWPEQGDDPEELLKRADAAMHRAKQSGRNTFCRFTPSMLEASARRLRLNTGLRLALDRGELAIHYQPIVSLGSRAVVGAEALLRWRHAESGWIAPAEFVPLAEETGFIRDIGAWVLDGACRQLSLWLGRRPDFNLAVNLSLQQLRHDQLAQMVRGRLEAYGCDPRRLTLELTETSLLYDTDRARRTLTELRAMGLRIAVDDFGTGCSSLSHLQCFAVDTVKVDRSFVAGMIEDRANRAIVTAVLALARALGLEVVAEGIESDAQHAALLGLGCTTGQGFLFGRPVPADDFERRFIQHI